MKGMLALPFILLFFALFASAIDTLTFDNCEALGISDCLGFSHINASEHEQKKILSSLLERKTANNMHDFIYNWNSQINFTSSPKDAPVQNYKTIKDAWLDIGAIMPSVMHHNLLFINSTGFVFSAYSYNLTLPSDYFNGAWALCSLSPPTSTGEGEEGDCRTEYPQNWDESNISQKLNGDYLGNKSIVSYETVADLSEYQSELAIVNKIERRHFSWQQADCCQCSECCWECGRPEPCCERNCDRCGCEIYEQRCESSSTDYRYDELALFKSKTGASELPDFEIPSILFDENKGIAYATVNSSQIAGYDLRIGNAIITRESIAYSYNYSYAPFNVLSAIADDKKHLASNVYAELQENENNDILLIRLPKNQTLNCSMLLHSFFSSFESNCSIQILPKTNLTIIADKFFYMPDEIIHVNFTIESIANTENDIVSVSYANQSFNVTGSSEFEFRALRNFNTIVTEYKTDLTHQSAETYKTIHVYEGEKFRAYISVFWILLTALAFGGIFRHLWKKMFGVNHE